MTDKEKYLRACEFAINRLIENGSTAVMLDVHSDNQTLVKHKDVLEWIDKQLDMED